MNRTGNQFQGPRRGIGSSFRSTAEANDAAQKTQVPGRTQEAAQPGEVQREPSHPVQAQPAPAGLPDDDPPHQDESDVEEAEKTERYEQFAR